MSHYSYYIFLIDRIYVILECIEWKTIHLDAWLGDEFIGVIVNFAKLRAWKLGMVFYSLCSDIMDYLGDKFSNKPFSQIFSIISEISYFRRKVHSNTTITISNLFDRTFMRFYSHASTQLNPFFCIILFSKRLVGIGSRFEMLYCISAYPSSLCAYGLNITTTNTIYIYTYIHNGHFIIFSVCSSSLTEYRIQTNWFTPQQRHIHRMQTLFFSTAFNGFELL